LKNLLITPFRPNVISHQQEGLAVANIVRDDLFPLSGKHRTQ